VISEKLFIGDLRNHSAVILCAESCVILCAI